MVWTPRQKAFAFSAFLILTSTAFLVSAAAQAEGVLRPFREGKEFPHERALSRGATPLAVFVAAEQGESKVRVEGAKVTVTRMPESSTEPPVGIQTTDVNGRALFHLRAGEYVIRVAWAGGTADHPVKLHHGQRIAAVFSEEGAARWVEFGHKDLERRGDTAALRVTVNQANNRSPMRIEGVTITVYPVGADGAREADGARSTTTGPRGAALFVLHRGLYEVEATHEGKTGVHRVELRRDTNVAFLVQGDGMTATDGPAPQRGPPPAHRDPRDDSLAHS